MRRASELQSPQSRDLFLARSRYLIDLVVLGWDMQKSSQPSEKTNSVLNNFAVPQNECPDCGSVRHVGQCGESRPAGSLARRHKPGRKR